MSSALRFPQGILNWRWGGGQSLQPPTQPSDPNRKPFEFRTEIGPDESCSIKPIEGQWYVLSSNGKSVLTVTPDGKLEERKPDQVGAWERFTYDPATKRLIPLSGAVLVIEVLGDQPSVTPPPGKLSRLRATKLHFLNEQNQPVFFGGVSAFMHYERFLRGEDIDPLLRQAQDLGCNGLRVFGMAHYIPVNAGRPAFKPQDFGPAYFDRMPEFMAKAAGFGMYVYWSVFPDCDLIMPGIDQQRPFFDRVVAKLKESPNTIGELTNEQDAHSFNQVDPAKLTRPSGIAFCSGSYGDIGGPQPVPWDFVDYHVPRDWPTKAVKDSNVVDHPNYVQGLGVMLGEPERFGPGGHDDIEHARLQAGAARENALGHVFHSVNGRESQPYNDRTLEIARVWFKAAIGAL